jgi:hypothetical protein
MLTVEDGVRVRKRVGERADPQNVIHMYQYDIGHQFPAPKDFQQRIRREKRPLILPIKQNPKENKMFEFWGLENTLLHTT